MTALFGNFSPARINAIVDDLLRKEPRGGGDRAGMEFEVRNQYCNRYNHWRDIQTCNKIYWGYTELEIARLGMYNHSAVESYVMTRFYPDYSSHYHLPSGQKAGASRKINRIWDRIENIRRASQRGSLPGVYEISAGSSYYAPTVGYVIADNGDHASQLGTTLFGCFAPDVESFAATWKGFPNIERLERLASKLQAKFREEAEELESTYLAQKAENETNARNASMAQMVALDLVESLREADTA
jgi:hypothetical protein